MNLEEFQDKLQTVSDQKLYAMLKKARKVGPEVAEKILVTEVEKRGLDLPAHTGLEPSTQERNSIGDLNVESPELLVNTPVAQADWLKEESRSGFPMWAKVLIGVAIFLGIVMGVIKSLSST